MDLAKTSWGQTVTSEQISQQGIKKDKRNVNLLPGSDVALPHFLLNEATACASGAAVSEPRVFSSGSDERWELLQPNATCTSSSRATLSYLTYFFYLIFLSDGFKTLERTW